MSTLFHAGVITSRDCYPQCNGKLERWHATIKSECVRPGTPRSLEDARRLVSRWAQRYNQVRLHSALGYIAPADKLAGREAAIFAQRDHKLEAAREQRQTRRNAPHVATVAVAALAN
jgi:putative transposase